MSRGVKFCYIYNDKNGEQQVVYARNESEAQRIAGTKVERVHYGKNDQGLVKLR